MRSALPDLVLRTTFLVGFPGETDAHVENLLRFVKDVEFDRVGVFTYSAEEGTPAFTMEDRVEPAVMRARRGAVMEAQQSISLRRNRAWIGREINVLVESTSPAGCRGRSYRDAPEIDGEVHISSASAIPGEHVRVRVESAEHYDLTGARVCNPANVVAVPA
jgi:ribosomal protein S12 methylthiotransferase